MKLPFFFGPRLSESETSPFPLLPESLFGMLALPTILLLATTGCGRRGNSQARREAPPIAASAGPVDFNRSIRPILNEQCIFCHGGVKKSGGISFIFREEATQKGESGKFTIVPGDPERSELLIRLLSKDPEKRMPPVDHGSALAPDQIALFRQWIKEGARWAEHWAFIPPKAAPVPALEPALASRARGPIDHFVLDRLSKAKLTPAREADRATLLRRVSYDLTGVPPTIAELRDFENDPSPQAYEKQVDRLLASPRYGERWASVWLDLARYADTLGYEKDMKRTIWPYRDWLIDALNQNLHYDDFVTRQLAGDLLPNATLSTRLATAFHRNTMTNDEGGTSNEEFRLAAVQDRATTTWSALNGVTFNCVQCHSHPYDPIRNQEYYSFLSFFNSSADADYDGGFDYPTLRVPDDRSRDAEVVRLITQIGDLRRDIVGAGKALESSPNLWQRLPVTAASAQPAAQFELKEGEAFINGTVDRKTVYELQVGSPAGAPITAIRVAVPPLDAAKARLTPEFGFIVTRIEASIHRASGADEPVIWNTFWGDSAEFPFTIENKVAARKRGKAGKDPEEPEFQPELPPNGFAAYVLSEERWLVGVPSVPLELKAGDRLILRFHHNTVLESKPAVMRRIRVSATSDLRWRSLAQKTQSVQKWAQADQLENQLVDIPGTDVPVMAELPKDEGREMRVFVRGNFLNKAGAPLAPDVPSIFPPLPKDEPANRLTLAHWLFGPDQPLTARVAVNRYWEQLFGLGIVETLEDFGSIGRPPSNPELLDWLAVHFQTDLHWDVKALLREMVLSATYRQSSPTTPDLQAKDPRNVLLARGPRNRLTAEMVRDGALFASGLLSSKMHGPPVMPPQPEGVWSSVYNNMKWEESKGEEKYRRAVYTFWRRTSAYPSMISFDGPSRDVCTVRRMPTDTPLQALVTLNDPVYVEAAQALAARMQTEGGADVTAQIGYGFRLVTSRLPANDEIQPLRALDQASQKFYAGDAAALKESGAASVNAAALSAVASAILNLDPALNK